MIEDFITIEDKYNTVKKYYNKALELIVSNKIQEAKNILHKEMSVELYDLSLDILCNYNQKFLDLELRTLILQVDKQLNDNKDECDSTIMDDNEIF